MRFFLCFLFSVVISFACSAQAGLKKITGKVSGLPAQAVPRIALDQWVKDEWKMVASDSLSTTAQYEISWTCIENCIYRLRMWGKPEWSADFLYTSTDFPKEVHIDVKLAEKMTLAFEDARENSLYQKLIAKSIARDEAAKSDSTGKFYWEAQDALKIAADEVMTISSSSFLKEVIVPCAVGSVVPSELQKGSKAYWEFKRIHDLEKIPFAHPQLTDHYFFVLAASRQWKLYHDQKWPFAELMDKCMNTALGNDQNAAYLFRFFLEKCMDHKNEEALSHLIAWYAPDCATEGSSADDATKNLVKALESCKPGKTVENLTLPDAQGKMVSLHTTCKKNKQTVLMFWRTNCTHCKEFEPELEEMYRNYHDQGFEVFAICADKDDVAWKQSEKTHAKPWISTFLAPAARKDFSKRFPVPSTPTLFLLDAEGKITHRMVMRSRLQEYLVFSK
jgi:thiol-disulfide isomerase/thioredoxin